MLIADSIGLFIESRLELAPNIGPNLTLRFLSTGKVDNLFPYDGIRTLPALVDGLSGSACLKPDGPLDIVL